MENKDIILGKWIQGEVTDEEVKSFFPDVDLDYLRSTIDFQDKVEIKVTEPNKQWDIFEASNLEEPKPKPKSNIKPILWVALSLLLVATIYFLAQYLANDSTKNTIIKPDPQEHKIIALQDQSQIRLAPGSSIEYNEDTYLTQRDITLSGEAFFEVEKGAPFSVKTEAGIVQVLGTSFNIWTPNDKNAEIKCFSGRVQVIDNKNKKVTLNPNEKVVIEDGDLLNKNTFNASIQSSNDSLKYYENAKVEWVIDDLEKLYELQFTIPDELEAQRFTGVISIVDSSKALSYLCETMEWSYSTEKSAVTIQEEN